MKKNLNIAYLNGAEGMIRRGGASSGGSGESNDEIEYFKIDFEQDYDTYPVRRIPLILKVKQIYKMEGATYDETVCINAFTDYSGISNAIAIACYNTSLIVGGVTVKESNWKNTVAKYVAIAYSGLEDTPPEQDILNFLNYLVPITKEDFYNLYNDNAPD